MSKFTPAPWSWVIEADGRLMITHNGEYLPPTIDNANLIVAAPLMREVLQEMLPVLEAVYKQAPILRDFLINKVRPVLAEVDGGEPNP